MMGTPAKALLVGILGHTGFAGDELRKRLLRHAMVAPVLLDLPPRKIRPVADQTNAMAIARRALARPVAENDNLPRQSADDALIEKKLDAVFLSTPPEISAVWAPRFLEAGVRVIDLSGAFRLPDAAAFESWYGVPHPCPELLSRAAYGLTEINRQRIAGADLIANPGCYATAANLALYPLARAGLVDSDQLIVCDGKSGVSGAGKGDRNATNFCSVAENFAIYAGVTHRHAGEIVALTGIQADNLTFTAQLLPVRRGLLLTVHFRLRPGVNEESIGSAYRQAYGGEAFVEMYEPGSFPDLNAVVLTNFCHLGYTVNSNGRRALVVAAIDNLLKGAAGQAIQNLNAMFGVPETEGLA